MKKIMSVFALLIVGTFIIVSFTSINKKVLAEDTEVISSADVEVNKLFGNFYNNGTYTKHTTINLCDVASEEIVSYFHAKSTVLERTTYYKGDALWMSRGEKDSKFSYYGTAYDESGKAIGVTNATASEALVIPEKANIVLSGSGKNSMEEYYVTLTDFVNYDYTNPVWTETSEGVYETDNDDIIDKFRLFTAPCFLEIAEAANYVTYSKATLQIENNNLVMKLHVDSTNSGLLTEEAKSQLVFSQAVIDFNLFRNPTREFTFDNGDIVFGTTTNQVNHLYFGNTSGNEIAVFDAYITPDYYHGNQWEFLEVRFRATSTKRCYVFYADLDEMRLYKNSTLIESKNIGIADCTEAHIQVFTKGADSVVYVNGYPVFNIHDEVYIGGYTDIETKGTGIKLSNTRYYEPTEEEYLGYLESMYALESSAKLFEDLIVEKTAGVNMSIEEGALHLNHLNLATQRIKFGTQNSTAWMSFDATVVLNYKNENSTFTILIRSYDTSHGYKLVIKEDTMEFYKLTYNGGTVATLISQNSYGIAAGVPTRLQIVCRGNGKGVLVNGEKIFGFSENLYKKDQNYLETYYTDVKLYKPEYVDYVDEAAFDASMYSSLYWKTPINANN